MKTAFYVDDAAMQLVLTPETEADRTVLEHLERLGGLQVRRCSALDEKLGDLRFGDGYRRSLIITGPVPKATERGPT